MIDLTQNLGATNQFSREFANEAFHFERRLAEVSMLFDASVFRKWFCETLETCCLS